VTLGVSAPRPLFVQGAHDNPRAVIRTLTDKLGDGNFDVVAPVVGSAF
jgi:hypothetical protein